MTHITKFLHKLRVMTHGRYRIRARSGLNNPSFNIGQNEKLKFGIDHHNLLINTEF